MTKNLLIVESPSKAKTLRKYLGKDFEILASYGHVRDLIPKKGAVDPENHFKMKYEAIARNKEHVAQIVKAAENSTHIYLATDPDREGEAISWHLQQILQSKKKLKDKPISRVAFHEVTKSAVLKAIQEPRALSQPLIEAQQTRRALDYLVGFNLSPLLWKKIRRGLSAGRTQSPALRLIAEREEEIAAFKAQEYWTIHLDSHKEAMPFSAKLTHLEGQKLAPLAIKSKQQQEEILHTLENQPALIETIAKKKRKRRPMAPFSTSTLQQEAVQRLSMPTSVTMRVAQQLYEGLNIGHTTMGLITYMRTDSVSLSQEAIHDIRSYIKNNKGENYLPKSPRIYATKTKNAQEAHEAIRPTLITNTPDKLRPYLKPEQLKLYTLIWKRALASQMSDALFDATAVDIAVGPGLFRANGQVLTFEGFLSVYQDHENGEQDKNNDKKRLPELTEGEELTIDHLRGEQHFTQPLPRYNEASLVKALEEYGIGRPSTYATIISTLKIRDYVTVEQKQFIPTDTGKIVNKFLTEHFKRYVDYGFTAKMEDDLDNIAKGEEAWLPIMNRFWTEFSDRLQEKETLSRKEVLTESLEEVCPQCKTHKLEIRYGRNGRFIGCKGYPECTYTRNIDQSAQSKAAESTVVEGRQCPECGGDLAYKQGRYGKFIGCSNYPKCKYIESLNKPQNTGIACPQCGKGTLTAKKSRYGTVFYSCSEYPTCKYSVSNLPVGGSCPQCGWPILTIKETKRWGKQKVCPQKNCDFKETLEPPIKN